jgi:hypothetical protein
MNVGRTLDHQLAWSLVLMILALLADFPLPENATAARAFLLVYVGASVGAYFRFRIFTALVVAQSSVLGIYLGLPGLSSVMGMIRGSNASFETGTAAFAAPLGVLQLALLWGLWRHRLELFSARRERRQFDRD